MDVPKLLEAASLLVPEESATENDITVADVWEYLTQDEWEVALGLLEELGDVRSLPLSFWEARAPTGEPALDIARLWVERKPCLEPGGRASVRLAPLTPQRWRQLEPGQVITMHEDRSVAGTAVVLEAVHRPGGRDARAPQVTPDADRAYRRTRGAQLISHQFPERGYPG
ncbi:hypothetical protein ACGFYO_23895 [Streptomyces sp. NPDC048201]|uniref:hypothetical protein n=1 Tax=Streptomyces sp. NPDC048201 TaxID=3365513 RepID=UPI003722DF71